MPDMIQDLQRERQQEEAWRQQELQHLTQLSDWNLEENQQLGQRKEEQQNLLFRNYQENSDWLKQFYDYHVPVQAAETAQGRPVQEYVPQEVSWWDKRRKRKAAKEIHKAANETTYDLAAALTQRRREIDNSLDVIGGLKAVDGHGYDSRVLIDFSQGHKIDSRTGEPANEIEAEKQKADLKFYIDYDSRVAARREPHLNRMVDELLRIRIDDWMLTQPYLTEHIAELREKGQKLLLIQNIKEQNVEYFERLQREDPVKFKILDAQATMGAAINGKMSAILHECCIDTGTDTYMDEKMCAPSDFAGERAEMDKNCVGIVQAAVEILRDVVQPEINGTIELHRQKVMRERQGAGGQPELAAAVLQYQDMILMNRENYEANREIVDKVYTELFRTLDAWDDVILQTYCTRTFREDYDVNSHKYAAVQIYSNARENELKEMEKAIDIQVRCLDNLFRHVLLGEELEANGTVAAKRLGYHQRIEDRPRTELDEMDTLQYLNTMVDEKGAEHVTLYTREDQNITIPVSSLAAAAQKTVSAKEKTKQAEKRSWQEAFVEGKIAQTSAKYSYAYKTQTAAVGRMLWMGHPPHEKELFQVHTKLSVLGSKLYEPIEVEGKNKAARLECAKKQINRLKDELGEAIESCQHYVKLWFGLRKEKREARNLVKETLAMLQADYSKLEHEAASLMYRAIGGDMTYGDLLGDARATVIDLNREEKNLGRTGANMSDVITVGEGEGKLFFKEEEYVRSAVDVFRQKFMSTWADKRKYGGLLKLLEDFDRQFHGQDPEITELMGLSGVIGTFMDGYANAVKAEALVAMDASVENMIKVGEGASAALTGLGLSVHALQKLFREVSPGMKKAFAAQANLLGNAKVSKGSKVALRNVATSRMASLLGIDQVVVKSTTAIVQEKGKQQRRGIVMARARGRAAAEITNEDLNMQIEAGKQREQAITAAENARKEALEKPGADQEKVKQEYQRAKDEAERIYEETINNNRVKYAPDAVRQLVNLHLLDLICGQTDRHRNNYFVTTNQEGRIDGVQGIDNDVSFGELKGEELADKTGYLQGMGGMNLPVMDREMYDSLWEMTDSILRVNLGDLLTAEELVALVDRIKAVRNYLKERVENRELTLVSRGQWTDAHAAEFKDRYSGYVNKEFL